jgi:diaminopimelate epimerase
MTGLPRLVKMSGAGNDFIVLDAKQFAALQGDAAWVRRVCRRGLSVGADGVLVVEPQRDDRVKVVFYNPDGSEAFCGNGSRCAARYAHERGFTGPRLTLLTHGGEIPAEIDEGRVRLTLRPPRYGGELCVEWDEERLEGHSVDAGTPHFVVWSEQLDTEPLHFWGPRVRRHPVFGAPGTNLDLIAFRANGAVAIRTWERGVEGETLACGSGAVAAAHVARLRGAAECVTVLPASGVSLRVELPGAPGEATKAVLEGDARFIFEADLSAEATLGFPAAAGPS